MSPSLPMSVPVVPESIALTQHDRRLSNSGEVACQRVGAAPLPAAQVVDAGLFHHANVGRPYLMRDSGSDALVETA